MIISVLPGHPLSISEKQAILFPDPYSHIKTQKNPTSQNSSFSATAIEVTEKMPLK